MRNLALLLAAGLAAVPATATIIFEQDFNSSSVLGDYINELAPGAGQFNYAGNDSAATVSITDGAYTAVIDYTTGTQTSLARFTRSTDLTVPGNFTFVSYTFSFDPVGTAWPFTTTTTLGGLAVGTNFRIGTTLTPQAPPNGPLFAAPLIQAKGAAEPDQFGISAGGSLLATFPVAPVGGVYTVNLIYAFNGSGTSQTVQSPSGEVTIDHGRISAWANGTQVVNNVSNGVTATTTMTDFSWVMGDAAAKNSATGAFLEGIYTIDNIVISPTTVPEPAAYTAALAGVALLLGLWRRRRAGAPVA